MALTWCLQLLLLCLFLDVDISGGIVTSCPAGWFGSSCQYKCHCEDNNCDNDGECTGSSTCERGWFGPACQYVDLISTNTTPATPDWVYDFPDTLCNPGQETVTVLLIDTFYFTWLRLHTNSSGNSTDFQLQFSLSDGSPVKCLNMYMSFISSSILDIHCVSGHFFQELLITGGGVSSLCSVYISGGRNVALRQQTNQSSVYAHYNSSLAVDGNINGNLSNGSCSYTNFDDDTPTWTLNFEIPHMVNRYVLYNRDGYPKFLRGFNMTVNQANGTVAFPYADSTNMDHAVYRINSLAPQIAVSNVKIIATYNDTSLKSILSLCEVEMFGDTVCAAGRYGRECEYTCNCTMGGRNCFVSTGGCLSACLAGYYGPQCEEGCAQPYYGTNCTKICSTNCRDQICDSFSEACLGCIPGRQGSLCDQKCNSTYYGDNCSQRCSTNCADRLCEPSNGTCYSCIDNKLGPMCSSDCPRKTFGKDCVEHCSTNCNDQLCDSVTGKCASCEPGLTGNFCESLLPLEAPAEPSSSVALIVGPVVGFVVLVVLTVIGVLFWRRHRNKSEQTPADRFQGEADTESNINIDESNCVRTEDDTDIIVRGRPPVMKKPQLSLRTKDSPKCLVTGDYFNFIQRQSDDSISLSELDVAEQRQWFTQDQTNNDQVNNNKTPPAVHSSSFHKSHRNTNNTEYDAYVMPKVSTALPQNTGHLPYEYQETSKDNTKANSYLELSNNVNNTYDVIDDISFNPYDSVNDDDDDVPHIYNAIIVNNENV